MKVKMDFSQQQALLKERQRQYQESLGAEMEHSNLYGFRVPSRLPLCSTTSMDVNVCDLEDLSLDDMSNPGSLGTPDDLEYDFDDADVFDIVDFEDTDLDKGGKDSSSEAGGTAAGQAGGTAAGQAGGTAAGQAGGIAAGQAGGTAAGQAGGTAGYQQANKQIPAAGSALTSATLPAPVTTTNYSPAPASLTQADTSRTSSNQSRNMSQQPDLPQNACHLPNQCEGSIHNDNVISNQSTEACQHGQFNYRVQLDTREASSQNPTTDINTNKQILEKETLV
ncbi:uncharacterized protein LOC144880417 [Branchiostoma floridae x Branchiostoma japonicum]